MRKVSLFLFLFGLVTVCGCGQDLHSQPQTELNGQTGTEQKGTPENPVEVTFSFIGESSYEPATLYEEWRLVEGDPITLWDSIAWQYVEEVASEEQWEPPKEFDDEKYSFIISYGREIAALHRWDVTYYGEGYNQLVITFDEEYCGDKVFLYQAEKRHYLPAIFHAPCYVLREEERHFLGETVQEVNQELNNLYQ